MPIFRPLGRRRSLGPATLVLLLFAVAACDLTASPSASPSSPIGSPGSGACGPEEVAPGGIEGRVVDADGNPLSDILVQLETASFYGSQRTGDDGIFRAPGVAGDFVITTTDLAYVEVVREVSVPCGDLVEVELVLTPTDG
jgi:hypothetical protein